MRFWTRPVYTGRVIISHNVIFFERTDPSEIELVPKHHDFVPSFKKYPEFHYTDQNLFSGGSSASTVSKRVENGDPKPSSTRAKIVTIKIRTNLDADFVEIELEPTNTSLDDFKKICLKEFDHVKIDPNVMKLEKIRKLPDVLIRNTNDVRRLKDDNAVEFCFVGSKDMNLI